MDVKKQFFQLKQEGDHLPTLVEIASGFYKANCDQNTYFPDYIATPVPLVSSEVTRVLRMYMTELDCPFQSISNSFDSSQHMYFSFDIPVIEGLSDQTVYDKSGLNIQRFVLENDSVKDSPLFKIKHYRASYVFVRLDLAESILRRALTGFQFDPVEVV